MEVKIEVFRNDNRLHYAFQAIPPLDPSLRVGCERYDNEDKSASVWWVFWEVQDSKGRWRPDGNYETWNTMDEALAFATAGAWAITGGVRE